MFYVCGIFSSTSSFLKQNKKKKEKRTMHGFDGY